jgi:hypothetical protein
MKKAFRFITTAVLCLIPICWGVGQFDNQFPGQSVYPGTFTSLKRTQNQWTLTGVNIHLQALPEGFIEEATEIWPAIKLTPEGIFANIDIHLGDSKGYAAITHGISGFFSDPGQPILLKNMAWDEFTYDLSTFHAPYAMTVDIWTYSKGEEINVIYGGFDVGKLPARVYHVRLSKDNHIWNRTLQDVIIPLHTLPEGLVMKPTQVWPAIKLTAEGIYAHADLQITGICTQGYDGATAYLTKLIREAQNRIIIKNMMWMGWWVADNGYDKVGIECEVYIIKDDKEINVGEQMIEAGYARACDGC